MRVAVDFDLCESNGLCEGLAPDIFELDDDDFLQLKTEEVDGETEPETVAAVRGAVAACPKAAISLVDPA